MTTLPSWLLPALASAIVALLMAGITLIISIARDVAGLQVTCTAHEKSLEGLPSLAQGVDRLLYRQQLADEVMGREATMRIHSPIHVERDALMDKLDAGTLSQGEAKELVYRLEQLLAEETNGSNRWAASFQLIRALEIARRPREASAILPVGEAHCGRV